MLKVACPNCGAEVLFRSPALPVKVCDYCRTAVMRIGEGVRSMGKIAELPFDVSPIRIGTRGRFDGRRFEVIGRVRWGWTDGSWNEWLLQFDDAASAETGPWAGQGPTHGWLGEAMGQFMVTTERPLDEIRSKTIALLAEGRTVPIGTEAQIDDEVLTVADIRDATCIASEGELPFTASAGWTITSVDLRSPSGRAATLQRDHEESAFFDGRYVTLAELAATNLREIEGWAAPRFAPT